MMKQRKRSLNSKIGQGNSPNQSSKKKNRILEKEDSFRDL